MRRCLRNVKLLLLLFHIWYHNQKDFELIPRVTKQTRELN